MLNKSRHKKLDGIFQAGVGAVGDWLRKKGYNDSVSDGLASYFHSVGAVGIDLSDMVDNKLNALGYGAIGTLDDKLNAFFETKSALGNRGDNERKFFDSNGTFT